MEPKWREILEKVESGELTAEEGAVRMAEASRYIPQDEPPPQPVGQPPASEPAAAVTEVVEDYESAYNFWKNWWALPLWAGAGIFAIGVILLAWGDHAHLTFWFVCGMFPLLLGLAVMLLSIWSRKARWLHVRVRDQGEGRRNKVSISMPLPVRLIGWVLKTFGGRIPGLREQPQVIQFMPEIMAALAETGDPLIVEVNEPDGAEVRVYIL